LRPLLIEPFGEAWRPLTACGQVGLLLFLAALGDALWSWIAVTLIWIGLDLDDRRPDWSGQAATDVGADILVANYLAACEGLGLQLAASGQMVR
jgi:hypothetical protein